jgi:hypothetical protein
MLSLQLKHLLDLSQSTNSIASPASNAVPAVFIKVEALVVFVSGTVPFLDYRRPAVADQFILSYQSRGPATSTARAFHRPSALLLVQPLL